jgi:hypothetical protein
MSCGFNKDGPYKDKGRLVPNHQILIHKQGLKTIATDICGLVLGSSCTQGTEKSQVKPINADTTISCESSEQATSFTRQKQLYFTIVVATSNPCPH